MSQLNKSIKLGASALLLSLASVIAIDAPVRLQAQEADTNTTIEDLEKDASNVVGEQVTVRGGVNEVEPGISFEIAEEDFLQGGEILVINATGEMLPEVPDGDLDLQVTGEVGTFLSADIETYNSMYDYDLDPDLYVDYENKPVIFAESVALAPGIEDISDNPEDFYSREVALKGEIGEIKGDMAFTIVDDDLLEDTDMLVVNMTGEPIPVEDGKIVATGMVREFVIAEFEQDYDLTLDLDIQQELEAEYDREPVLVIDSVYSVEE